MRLALVTTTINIPHVLALYRKLDPSIRFFVSGDIKTPHEAMIFCRELPNCVYLSPEEQRALNYESSELIGWNTDSRRNIAVLEALRWGADVLISVDDDMLPSEPNVTIARQFEALLTNSFSGLQLGAPQHWMNVGAHTVSIHLQRGLPLSTRVDPAAYPQPVVGVRIGVAQGIILGVADASATGPAGVSATDDVLRSGFVVHPAAYAVFNSQWTAFRRDLAPGFMQSYKHQQRNTDIFASLIMRRVMRELNLYTHYGPPTAFHARQSRPLLNDLKAEMFGIQHVEEFVAWLDGLTFAPAVPSFVMFNYIYVFIDALPWMPAGMQELGLAWLRDCEKAMS